MQDLILGVTTVQGKHTGKNLAKYFMQIVQTLGVESKIFCVTADNASNNATMAAELEKFLPNFKAENQMLGCVGHVINLAAKAGLKAIRQHHDENFDTDMVRKVP